MTTTVGVLGVGKAGSAIARQALKAGYEVRVATDKPVEDIELLTDIVIPGARAVDKREVVAADLVVIAIPLPKYRTLDPVLFEDRIVIDVMNYWAPTDGTIADFETQGQTSSEVIQDHLPGARLVKSLNHIGYHDLEADHREPGATDRRALAVAGDHSEARKRS